MYIQLLANQALAAMLTLFLKTWNMFNFLPPPPPTHLTLPPFPPSLYFPPSLLPPFAPSPASRHLFVAHILIALATQRKKVSICTVHICVQWRPGVRTGNNSLSAHTHSCTVCTVYTVYGNFSPLSLFRLLFAAIANFSEFTMKTKI
jgi:hypothetical protein